LEMLCKLGGASETAAGWSVYITLKARSHE